MADWEGKSRGNLLGYKIFYAVLKTLGLLPAYGLLFFISLYYLFFVRDARRYISEFYQIVFGWRGLKAFSACRKNFYSLGQ